MSSLLNGSEKPPGPLRPDLQQPGDRIPRVLISGRGFGALLLAILLERLGIPYYLFGGGSSTQQNLGAALAIGPTILPVFEQLGLTSLLASMSLPFPTVELFDSKLKKLGVLTIKVQSEADEYNNLMCSRMNLFELLLTQLNPNHVLMGKKILSYEENELGVNVCCADNSTYCGDILVGADGSYSRIRQTLHRNMHKRGLLSKADKEQRMPGYVCVTGIAKQNNHKKYPYLKDPYAHFCSVLGTKGFGWHTINIPDDQICWAMWMQLDTSAAEKLQQGLENSGVDASDTEPITRVFRDMLSPHGGTMGDLVDSTPQDIMSKVYVEEKLYDSWYLGRTVLLGDACHSMLPWAGQKEVNEMHDAVILANCLFEIKDLSVKSITATFKDYYTERYPQAKLQAIASRSITKLICGQMLKERISRYAILNWIPQSYQQRMVAEVLTYRPHISFMTPAESQGPDQMLPQMPQRQWTEDEVAKRVQAVWRKTKMDA